MDSPVIMDTRSKQPMIPGSSLKGDVYKRQGLQARDIKIVSGGTDNHLMLVDLTPYELTGKVVAKLLDSAHILSLIHI